MKAALLIVDMQKGCKGNTTKDTMESATEYINHTSDLFRKSGQTVVVIQDICVGEGPGSEEFEVLDEIIVAKEDIVVHKYHCNAFCDTTLNQTLKEKEIGLVVVCGFHADHCVLFTYNGACEQGYTAAILQHGIAGSGIEDVQNMQLKRPVVSHEVLEYMLKNCN